MRKKKGLGDGLMSLNGKLYQCGKIEGKSDIHDCMQFHYPKCFYDESAPMLPLSTA